MGDADLGDDSSRISDEANVDTHGRPAWVSVAASWARELVIIVVGALVISTVVRLFVAQMFLIPSGSMENTLHVQDRVLVQKVAGFNRGDVVVFTDPGGWLSQQPTTQGNVFTDVLVFVGLMPDESTQHLIKRVIGMPGDTVKCCDTEGRLTVNGYPLEESAYLYGDGAGMSAPSDFPFEVTVPADHIFVMGDHRNNSSDSRCHLLDGVGDGNGAFIPVSDVVGTAVWVVFPFSHWRGLTTPDAFAAVPDPVNPAPSQAVITNPGPGC